MTRAVVLHFFVCCTIGNHNGRKINEKIFCSSLSLHTLLREDRRRLGNKNKSRFILYSAQLALSLPMNWFSKGCKT